MVLKPGLNDIHSSDVDNVTKEANRDAIPVYFLSTNGRFGREAFFDAVSAVLPLDPELVGTHSWDALADSLWEGITSLESDRLVIIWQDAFIFGKDSPSEFSIALSVLEEVGRLLADRGATNGNPKEVCLYIVI